MLIRDPFTRADFIPIARFTVDPMVVPTIAEIGPAETTRTSPGGPILDKISRNNTVAINVADVRVRMEQQGALPITNTPDQCDAIMKTDSERKYESYPRHRRGGQSVITLGKNVQGDR